ncbi:hypothetical protein ACFO0N_13200 [Halobium salinum]|uniref:Uncharacterized protein n=1 Tax=Halobium salinum TaxID=1364940 RepID=A0ABD5PE14_9EURY|nr:hypothetical protein [Halobium salinum]
MPYARDPLVSSPSSRGLLALLVGVAVGALVARTDPVAAVAVGLSVAMSLYVLFAVGTRDAPP